ncbi:hypothetical protein Pst134EA_009206 [Puccinia striiformis f. sp. tritici]|uniref:hypothetical protein n=1 Tax=Puccinia striiformis f. sp. tritici TaxID=168172 RepID=UPI0020085A03|nr:hypothetical protein Pst134EA_009206 [Puccinia striiformis f. sp. tritici]KAH9468671.1 hypothetical protein Pst134EA_009206 [Puccinia striiformis f. sp. tritici]
MDPLGSIQQEQQQQQQNQHSQQNNPFSKNINTDSPATSWPSSPLIKPNAVGGTGQQQQQQPIIWPNRSNHSSSQREPRSPIREQPRRNNNNQEQQPAVEQQQQQANEKRPTKIRVTGIERNRRDLYIKFDAWSNLTTTRTGHCPNVSRSYKEFLSFHEALVSNNPHTIVPPIPFPNTSAPSPADDDRLVASAFQQFFDRLLINRFLRSDDELRIFIESDFGYTPQTKIKKRTITSGTGWLSKPSVGPSVRTLPSSTTQQSIGGGPETVVSIVEEDELSNAKLQFRLLEDRLVDSCRSVEQLSRSRRTLSQALLELSGRLVQFSTTESHGALAEGFRKLSQTLRSISELEGNSAVGYLVTLSDGLSWCSISAKAAKDVLRNRAGVLQEHYNSVKKSIEKRRLIERIKSSSNNNNLNVTSSDRIESALDELDQAKKNEELISIKSNLISNHLRPSLRQHSELLHDDLVYCLLENARTQLIYENQILIELERIKPELDSISLRPSNVIYSSSSGNQPPDHQPHHHTIHHHQQHPNTYQQNSTSTIINSHNIKPTPIRTSQISKKLQVHDRQGQNVDCRQRVDAKSAAASLARLF